MAKINFKEIYGDKTPLFLKMLIIFITFALITIILFWGLGFALSEPLFQSIRKDEAKDAASLIADNINNPELSLLVKRISFDSSLCIIVIDRDGNDIHSQGASENCSLHAFSSASLAGYYDKAKEAGDFYAEEIKNIPFEDSYDDDNFNGKVPSSAQREEEAYVYAKAVKSDSGEHFAILIETALTPSVAYTETIIIMFIVVSVLTAFLAGFLSYRLSKEVSQPLIALSEKAKEISSGSADLKIEEGGFKEITELSKSLQDVQQEVADLEHYRRELIANVSHDLRTPLTLIKGYTELMRDIPSEATAQNFQVVIDETARLTNLVNDMLSLSKEQEGNEELNLQRFDIVEMLDALITRHGKLIEHLGFSLEWVHDDKAYVLADETKITQVIYNLINNAVNYAGEDKKVIVKQSVKGGTVRIEVIDHGEGVDVNILPHIWDRYYKSDKSHRRATVGTGLGLSIVKSVMSKHPGGAYGVITSVGEGSTFYVELQRA